MFFFLFIGFFVAHLKNGDFSRDVIFFRDYECGILLRIVMKRRKRNMGRESDVVTFNGECAKILTNVQSV